MGCGGREGRDQINESLACRVLRSVSAVCSGNCESEGKGRKGAGHFRGLVWIPPLAPVYAIE